MSLYDWMTKYHERLVDEIAKDAICQIPSYREAPLRLTVERIDHALNAVAASIHQNDPEILEGHLRKVAEERQKEGYPISELHAVVQITEKHLADLILSSDADGAERNANLALLDVVMDAARMVLSVTYVIIAQEKQQRRRESTS
jgi:hypothetical protein